MQTQTIKTASGQFRVRLDGPADAPVLVFSNSLGTTLEMWDAQAVRFAKDYRVLRYDTRGHGGSVVSQGPYSVDQLGGDVVALLDALNIPRANFCGISMGGLTGLWLLDVPGWMALVACLLLTAGLRIAALWRNWQLPAWRV